MRCVRVMPRPLVCHSWGELGSVSHSAQYDGAVTKLLDLKSGSTSNSRPRSLGRSTHSSTR